MKCRDNGEFSLKSDDFLLKTRPLCNWQQASPEGQHQDQHQEGQQQRRSAGGRVRLIAVICWVRARSLDGITGGYRPELHEQ